MFFIDTSIGTLKKTNVSLSLQRSQNGLRIFSQMFIFGRFFKIYTKDKKKVEIEQNLANFENIVSLCLRTLSEPDHDTKVHFAFFNVPVVYISRGGHF